MSTLTQQTGLPIYDPPLIATETPAVGSKILVVSRSVDIPADTEKYVRAGQTLLQADYPELVAQLGFINASNFTSRTNPFGGITLNSLAYGNDVYLTGGLSSNINGTSTDGITWSANTGADNTTALTYGNGLFIRAGSDPNLNTISIATSTNGVAFTAGVPSTTSIIRALVYGVDTYVYAGDGGQLRTSTDGLNWTTRTSGTTSIIRALAYGVDTYVYAGDGGILRTSTNGITWANRVSGTTSTIRSLFYSSGLYLYSADGGVLGTSTNGITWSLRLSGTTSTINGFTYGKGIYVYAGNGGVLATSTNGAAWTSQRSGTTSAINALAYGNGTFVRVGVSAFGTNLATSNNPAVAEFAFGYNISTEFQVPSQSPRGASVTPFNSGATIRTYIRARP